MAKLLKRCEHAEDGWARCAHPWTVRFWEDGGRTQRERSFPANRKREANAFASNPVAATRDRKPAGGQIRFREYSELWLAGFQGSPNTCRAYERELRLRLLPKFGRRTLAEVAADREGVTAFLRSLPGPTAATTYTALRSMLSEARKSGRIPVYLLSGIRLAPAGRRDFCLPGKAQLTAVADAMPGSTGLAVWIMLGCGLRLGEALAVRRENFTNGRLRLTEQRYTTRVSGDPRTGPLKARKDGAFRDVPVPAWLQAMVDAHPVQSGYMFTIHGRDFHRAFRAAARDAGLPGAFVPHTLRHVFASTCLSRGVPISDVAAWLGHRNIQTTYGIYGHLIPAAYDSARAVLDQAHKDWSNAA